LAEHGHEKRLSMDQHLLHVEKEKEELQFKTLTTAEKSGAQCHGAATVLIDPSSVPLILSPA
jgi:hypothetical protein